ncbi:ACP S-malonyltransferase [Roseibium sp. LAB1]
MKVCMFPGQGAQRLGMGLDVFARFKDRVEETDDILGYSIAGLCQDGPIEKLSQTEYTQPALYVVNSLRYMSHLEETGERPDFLLGHSVSEYVALFAAGVLDFADGLRLVARRGALMSRAEGGGMAAVLGLEAAAVEELLRGEGVTDIFPANFNTPKQIVVSGRRQAVVDAEELFLKAGASHYKVLPVSGAFHTPFMEDARSQFAEFVAGVAFAPQQATVISNVTARPHVDADIRARMIEQITAPVRWSESLRYLLAKGVAFADTVEIGPDGPPVVRPMFKRTELEAGPLGEAELAAGLPAVAQAKSDKSEERHVESPEPEPIKLNGARQGFNRVSMETLGSRAFCDVFGVRYPYVSGAMYRGIASSDIVIRMAKAGLLGFFGAAGLPAEEVRREIRKIHSSIPSGAAFGINFIAHLNRPHLEDALTDVLLEEGVRIVEASAFMEVTQALVRYRAKGLRRDGGKIRSENKVIAKVSRPDVAAQFLAPAPRQMVEKLQQLGSITPEEAELLKLVPMADAICVEADSGGHTDQGMSFALIPPILKLRDAAQREFCAFGPLFVGAGGGIGTPEAAAAMLVLGADFLLTGSINQCTVEAGTSDAVKDMLEGINVYDTAYAPSGEMFELGSKIQVLKKGVFFPARSEKLVAVYRQHDGLEAIDAKVRAQIEERYFGRSFDAVFDEVAQAYPEAEIERARRMPKHRMALVFKRYYRDTTDWALKGDMTRKVDFQVHCGPAQGAFNQWVEGTELQSWRNRHVDVIGLRLLEETAALLSRRLSDLMG